MKMNPVILIGLIVFLVVIIVGVAIMSGWVRVENMYRFCLMWSGTITQKAPGNLLDILFSVINPYTILCSPFLS